jgi:hypothetical protein
MNSRFRNAALLLALGLSVSFVTSTGFAVPPKSYLVTPGSGNNFGLPKFGFSSSNIGFGERVVSVRFGGRAAALGLEPGDVILSLNGYQLSYPGSWTDALSQALYNGNYVRLKVRDVRTGNIRFRETYVDYYGGPVQHNYKSASNFGSPSNAKVKPFVPVVETIKEIKKLTK